jgi:hypothetical protein
MDQEAKGEPGATNEEGIRLALEKVNQGDPDAATSKLL